MSYINVIGFAAEAADKSSRILDAAISVVGLTAVAATAGYAYTWSSGKATQHLMEAAAKKAAVPTTAAAPAAVPPAVPPAV